MNISIARKRWIASIAIATILAIAATFGSDPWGDSASAATTVVGPATEIAKLTASDGALNDSLGNSGAAIDGDTLVVGAPFDDDGGSGAGSAYVYVLSGSSWVQQAKLTASDGAADQDFGRRVAIDGDTIVVGADAHDLSVGGDGDAGAAYVFTRSGTTWTQQQRLTAPVPGEEYQFGSDVGISGETIVIGEQYSGSVFYDAGAAYIYIRSGTTWTLQQTLTASDSAATDLFGQRVAIDGETVVVGARYDDVASNSEQGSVYVFVRSGTTWSQQQQITAADGIAGDHFGSSVDIDGDTIVSGANLRDDSFTYTGAAYVFTRSGTTWTQQQKLNASDAEASDFFGSEAAISGDTILISASSDDDDGTASGSAYKFTRDGTTWTQETKLTASDAEANDVFASSLDIDGNAAVIGASGWDGGSGAEGAAYVFGGPPNAPTGVTASAGNAEATASWTAPTNGGSPITSYTVTASPGGATINTAALTADFTGLTNGTAYTFVVTADNSIGTSKDSAASNAVTPVAPVSAEGDVLTDLTVTGALKLKTGQVVLLSASPINELSAVNLDMPSVVYTWAIDTCGTLSSTSVRTPIYTAPSDSGCTATVSVHASQGGGAQVPSSDREITIVVTAPPEPVPTVAPADPVVIPTIVPAGLDSDDVSLILPTTGGTFSVPQEAGDTAPPISLDVPGGALESGTANAVTINVISTGDLAAPPPPATEGTTSGTFSFGSTVIEVQWYDDDGNALDTKKLNKPAKICVPYVKADSDAAAGGPDGMSVWRYNGTAWVKLNSSVNVSDGTVCAYTSNFSVFALGLDVAPPAEAGSGSGLPATGGYTPNALTLALSMLAGLALIVSGVVAIRRTKRASTVL